MHLINLMLILAIISGQLVKLPTGMGSISLLDLLIFFLCLYGLIKLKLHLKKPSQFLLASFVFISIATISLIFTPLHMKPVEYLTSFSYTLRFSSYILLGWLAYSNAFKNFNAKNIILIYSGLWLAILGLLQFIFLPDLRFMSQWGWDPHYFRNVSTFLDPNFSGAFFTLSLILLAYQKPNKTVLVLFTLTYLALLTTFSRSSYIMFLTSGLALSFFQKSFKNALMVILLFTILFLSFQTYTKLISQPQHIDRKQSASLRFNAWQQGISLVSNFPTLGVGFNSYKYALRQLNLGDEEFLKSHGATSNDSSLLFVATTTGIIGLLAYLYFLFSLFYINYSNNRYILPSALLGLLAHSFFANSLFFPPILFWLLVIAASPKK